MVDNAVRTHFEPYDGISKKSDLMKIPLKNIYNAQHPDSDGACSCEVFTCFKCTTGLLNEMIAYLNSEERNHHNFQNFCFFLACLFLPHAKVSYTIN